MVKFKFSVNHGKRKKDEVVVMHKSTAQALVKHKMGEIIGKVEFKLPDAQKNK